MLAVTQMVTKGNRVCDVGCDHGFVSIYLVQNGISPKAIAMDVNEGPLQAAKENIMLHSLSDYIETRLSDGVKNLNPGEADTLICAGMGGRLIRQILEEGTKKLALMQEIILQPQSDIQGVREYLRKNGYLIVFENMIKEDGKYYPMMKAHPRRAYPNQREAVETEEQRLFDMYGPFLLENKHPVLQKFLERELAICENILASLNPEDNRQLSRRKELSEKRDDIHRALSYIEK